MWTKASGPAARTRAVEQCSGTRPSGDHITVNGMNVGTGKNVHPDHDWSYLCARLFVRFCL